jgi:trehalose 6-phosphate phosphatase
MPPFAPNWAFFLDVDGTLLDHALHPGGVTVGRDLRRLLQGLLAAADGAVAVISGRSVEDIDRLFAPLCLAAAGQHGTERRSVSGALHRHAPPLEHLARAAADLVRLTAAHEGLVLENKGMTLALHYRMAPQLHAVAEREVRRVAEALGDEFELQAGKFVFELKPSGRDKGSAIAEFTAEAPFRGRLPVFLGDDLTDEYGFEVVNRFGGHSVKVGPGPTGARWRIDDAAAVRRWLGEYVARLAGERAAAGR